MVLCAPYVVKKVKVRFIAESRLHNRPKRTAELRLALSFLSIGFHYKLFFSILGEITVKGEKGERGLRVSKYIINSSCYVTENVRIFCMLK